MYFISSTTNIIIIVTSSHAIHHTLNVRCPSRTRAKQNKYVVCVCVLLKLSAAHLFVQIPFRNYRKNSARKLVMLENVSPPINQNMYTADNRTKELKPTFSERKSPLFAFLHLVSDCCRIVSFVTAYASLYHELYASNLCENVMRPTISRFADCLG